MLDHVKQHPTHRRIPERMEGCKTGTFEKQKTGGADNSYRPICLYRKIVGTTYIKKDSRERLRKGKGTVWIPKRKIDNKCPKKGSRHYR